MNDPSVFLIQPEKSIQRLAQVPDALEGQSFLWLAYGRSQFEQNIEALQEDLLRLVGLRILDLHIADLLNTQLPSHFDFTSHYDQLVFRRLADEEVRRTRDAPTRKDSTAAAKPSGPTADVPATRKAQTMPVGFVVFDRILVSVHPDECSLLAAYVKRIEMLGQASPEKVAGKAPTVAPGSARPPVAPAELMLRMVGMMVDGYLDLRKIMTLRLEHWQQRLLRPDVRFDDWGGLLKARQALHHLYDLCEDQYNALGLWIEVLEDWPVDKTEAARHGHDLLLVRSRDVREHVERVIHHIRQLEKSAETAVQIHFNIQSNRTNDVMRMLTAITAIFLPLNLIAGIFGMNFQFIPGLHASGGFWWALGTMAAIALGLFFYFARKRYLAAGEAS